MPDSLSLIAFENEGLCLKKSVVPDSSGKPMLIESLFFLL
jgi:hypothetical protein